VFDPKDPQNPLELLMEEIKLSPVEAGSLSHYSQGLIHPRWISSINIYQKMSKHEALLKLGGITFELISRDGFCRGIIQPRQPATPRSILDQLNR